MSATTKSLKATRPDSNYAPASSGSDTSDHTLDPNATQALDAQGGRPGLNIVEGSCADPVAVDAVLSGLAERRGVVYHLAGNADIRGGADDRDKDLRGTVLGTAQELEGMTRHGVRDFVMTSSGAVYGEGLQPPLSVAAGPLQPLSLYGVGKTAAEAFAHAYCAMFSLRAWIFRLGNVVGARMSRGAIRDFITKLGADPTRLEILGDGAQRKKYLLVEDCVEALLALPDQLEPTEQRPGVVMNLGSDSTTAINTIARCVIEELGLADVTLVPLGGVKGWGGGGNQPFVKLDISELSALDWKPSRSSDEAVREGARRTVAEIGQASR
ncbi:NAD-dependent epimerase/dehydratase family protein [Streptomyces sp. NPDC060064]|uniref:NAD-dependent epimerase/dehydratase family protein n=1 Tax=Streptomyces sp. NPDC060064 TaxID=3347049 RepID=UPI003699CC10